MVSGSLQKLAALILAASVIVLSLACEPSWQEVGLCAGASLGARLSFSFFHASFLHAALNAWCLLCICFLYKVSLAFFLLAYLIAVCTPGFLLGCVPTVGLSALCFALLGFVSFQVRRKWYFHSCMALYIALGFLFPFINSWIHLYSYLAALLLGLMCVPFRKKY